MEILSEVGRCFTPSHEAFLFMWFLAALGTIGFFIALERFFFINRCTDYNAESLYDKVKVLVENKQYTDAVQLCVSGGKRALPTIMGAGIRKALISPEIVGDAMAEETVHMSSALERRLNYLVMISNSSTLLGLLGTVFGLIMSFAAVGKPGIDAVEKTALLASGISAAMNSTLVGLSISIISIVIFSWLRSRVDSALQEIDRYAIAILKIIDPPELDERPLTTLNRRSGEDEAPDTDVTPMLNLMVMLIPFLLTSSEFVKIGAIEMKLPEAAAGAQGGGNGSNSQKQNAKLDLGIVITAKGFKIYSYFNNQNPSQEPDIPFVNGNYDFEKLNEKLADIKRSVLMEIIKANYGQVPEGSNLFQLYQAYLKHNLSGTQVFEDNENIKIVAEERIKYKVVVAVMDAARGTRTPYGNVTMFPNVSIAGGIVQ